MHEISIAESILQIAEATARQQNARSIQLIKLRLGTFTTIVPDALQFAFDIARCGTLAHDAQLEIEIVPMVVRCAVCDASTQPIGGVCLICSQCGFPLEMISGEELQIEYIEVDSEKEDYLGIDTRTNLSPDQRTECKPANRRCEPRAIRRPRSSGDEPDVSARRG